MNLIQPRADYDVLIVQPLILFLSLYGIRGKNGAFIAQFLDH